MATKKTKEPTEVGDTAVADATAQAQAEPEIVVEAKAKPQIEGIDELRRQIEDQKKAVEQEREIRLKAERERDEAARREYAALSEKDGSDRRMIESALTQTKNHSAYLKQEYARSLAEQDYVKAAEIQEAMAITAARYNDLERGIQTFTDKPKPSARPLDPVEDYVQRVGPEYPRSKQWLRAHPEYVTDERLNKKMIAAHNLATADGIAPDSDEYFDSVEKTLNIRRPVRVQEEDESPFSDAAQPVNRAPPSIPPSRDMSPSGKKQRVVTLSPEEAEIARLTGQTEQEYYKNKMRSMN